MSDVFTRKIRSAVMAAIKSRGNRRTELKLAQIFRANGVTGWRRHLSLPGCPDFAFRSERVAVFVDGCFWHGCPKHGRNPRSNVDYWVPKLQRNRARDRKINRQLRDRGWRVIRFWEHSLRDERTVVERMLQLLTSERGHRVPPRLPARKHARAADSTGK
jgi:DNA mismatch endonuclease (patch repair protein)